MTVDTQRTVMAFFKEWVPEPAYLPAWLQAAAAIVAVAISVWAVRSGAFARRRDRLEMRGIAVAVYPEIETLKISTQKVRDGVALIKERDGNLFGQSVAASLQLTATIPVPPMMGRNIDKLFVLGDVAGPSCVNLVRLLIQYNATVESIAVRMGALNAEQWIEAVSHLEPHLARLDQVIQKCEHEVRPIHAAVNG